MLPPLYITGQGVVSAIGFGCADTLAALREGRSGIGPLRYLPTSLTEVPVGEVKASDAELSRLAKVPEGLPRTALMGMLALQEALESAGLSSLEGIPFLNGTTVGAMDLTERTFPRISPYHDCGATSDLIARHFGGSPWCTTLATACSSAANSVILGANLLRAGKADIVAVGGTEALSSFHLNGFNSLMIVDRRPCRPFDATRAGLNLGEGAAFLILETEASMRRRGAKPLGRLSGFDNACDAYHQTASSPEGTGAYLAMSEAVRRSGIPPEEIGYVNAHGTGTPDNDAAESAALRRLFGEKVPPVSSTKAFTGHTTSACGSIEAVFSLLALQEGFLPRQLNWSTPDPACIVPIRETTEVPDLQHVLCNAFGFGGNDSSLLLSRCL